MRRRALLSSVASLSLVTTAGCLADTRRTASGRITGAHGSAVLHPVDEQYVHGSFPDDADLRGWVFPNPPDDQRDVFTERAMQGRYSNDLLWADGDSFVLLFEVLMSPDNAAFYNVGLSPEWTGWNTAEIPIRRSPADLDRYEDADELVCTSLHKFEVRRGGAPERVTLVVHDDEMDATLGRYTLGEWTPQRSAASE
ncbi:hypothetical protein [Haloferax sp. YSMS24]|uniref:hypothetical protein n=1 Tax=Haloferax sp. YSMS24 TaxID=3388425 RepID=UPI00398C9098